MASIFTYDPEPPRVASPWAQNGAEEDRMLTPLSKPDASSSVSTTPLRPNIGTPTIKRLRAEPQEGPVEYKLHLLLRPRRKFNFTSTSAALSGSQHSRGSGLPYDRRLSGTPVQTLDDTDGNRIPQAVPVTSVQQTRQHRLEQLTTQLLWRLQQSSPHHTSSATNVILPLLPEATLPELQAPKQLGKLLHGLEESQGALYEVGVADDGSLVGLAEDEMHESLNNLRAMAACLGCTVEVLRREVVGQCEWSDDTGSNGARQSWRRNGPLVVAEALVKPYLQDTSRINPGDTAPTANTMHHKEKQIAAQRAEQLRVTLAGSTMSGKSTLLGTLTTSTLDNGKGKSRLSMLKHRHEITSGVTSSVTQELLGYCDAVGGGIDVLNYASENIASWIDMHAAVNGNRLILITDSAGHPRYHRTTVRGLVGWSPHYTLLCVPADDTEGTVGKIGSTQASQQALGPTIADIDLSSAQLDLCLKLNTPLVIVVTKLDLASRIGLKGTLTKILDALKAAGRKPAILPHGSCTGFAADIQTIPSSSVDAAYRAALPLLNDTHDTVPIVLTSAVQGTGISMLHALLHELPFPDPLHSSEGFTGFLFHIEDIYSKPAEVDGVIVSGRLRSGRISVGDAGAVGPFSIHDFEDSEDSDERTSSSSRPPTSRSFPGALRNSHLATLASNLPNQEWRRFVVSSIRNLRLPVHVLEPDQVGTIALAPGDHNKKQDGSATFARIRKGMVLVAMQTTSVHTFIADLERCELRSLAVGSHVVVYIASVRASARVLSASVPDVRMKLRKTRDHEDSSAIVNKHISSNTQRLSSSLCEQPVGYVTPSNLRVTLHFENSREFVVVGDQVLVMPSSSSSSTGGHDRSTKGIAGLEGFVGRIVEVSN